MKKFPRALALLVLASLVIGLLAGCGATPVSQVASGGAVQAEVGFDIPKNSQGHTVEQQNIIDRLRVTTDPTKVLWIHLLSLDGKILRRMPVSNKVTSSGKRLEPTTATSTAYQATDFPQVKVGTTSYRTNELLQPDGTFGSSDQYIFWFDPQHRYHQWGTAGGLGYLLTDYPIDLTNPMDLVTGMYNADKAATEWQLLQEQQLKKKEGK